MSVKAIIYRTKMEFESIDIKENPVYAGNTSRGIEAIARKKLSPDAAKRLIAALRENFEYVRDVLEEHVGPKHPCWCWKCRQGAGSGSCYENEERFIVWYETGSGHGHYHLTIDKIAGEIIFCFSGSERSFKNGGEYAAVSVA